MPKNALQDDKGNLSSIRIGMLAAGMVTIVLMGFWLYGFVKEVQKETSDYMGLAALFTAIFINFILVVWAKVKQKKYE